MTGHGGPVAADLVGARTALLDRTPRLSAEALRTALVDLHDFWLTSRAESVGIGNGTALAAVGALGRRELAPHSDLDLVLLHDGNRSDVEPIAKALWYPLWDARIGLDHSVRTVGQAVGVAEEDLRAAFGLLEVRLIAGDTALFASLVEAVRRAWRSGIHGRVDELVNVAEQRWECCGDVAHRVEPDLKSGHGGLRDIYLLDALATGQVIDRSRGDVVAARELLLDVRTELHRLAGRGTDVLRAQDADEVAAVLSLGDRFDLARALSGAGRAVVYAVDVAIRSARAAAPGRGARYPALGGLRRSLVRGPSRRPLDDGVVEQAGEVVLARDARPRRDPALVLRAAAVAARTGLPLAAGTLGTLADTAPELRRPWPRAALDELLSLLGAGSGAVGVVEALDRTGLWGRLLPEWGAVRDLPPRDRTHIWTVDRHLVETVAHAGRLISDVSRPDLLLLGALLHDVGKGRGRSHSLVGAAIAEQVGQRLGLWPSDVDTLSAMVRHHLLLPHTATRRDLDDPVTIERVVETLGGSVEAGVLLELLAALAEADGRATGPGAWSDWKARLISELTSRCRAVLAGRPLPEPEPLTEAQRRMAELGGVHLDFGGDKDGDHAAADATLSLTVVAPDRPGLLSRTAGVLALHSLRVHSASLRSHAGAAVDTFVVAPLFGTPPDPALLRQELVRSLDGSGQLRERLAVKERDYPSGADARPGAGQESRVLWFDDEATGAVVLELRAGDRLGLLHRVAAALESCAADVRWARLATRGGSVVDSFCLTGPGTGTLRREQRREVERAVLAAARAP